MGFLTGLYRVNGRIPPLRHTSREAVVVIWASPSLRRLAKATGRIEFTLVTDELTGTFTPHTPNHHRRTERGPLGRESGSKIRHLQKNYWSQLTSCSVNRAELRSTRLPAYNSSQTSRVTREVSFFLCAHTVNAASYAPAFTSFLIRGVDHIYCIKP